MHLDLSSSDDAQVVEAMMKVARQMRKTQNPQKAITAAKIELMFSKAIDELSATKPANATKEAGK